MYVFVHVFFYIYTILYIEAESENFTRKICRKNCAIQEEGCTQNTNYASEIPDYLPWEKRIQQCTLQK